MEEKIYEQKKRVMRSSEVVCVQTSPKEIGDVCTQASSEENLKFPLKRSRVRNVRQTREANKEQWT